MNIRAKVSVLIGSLFLASLVNTFFIFQLENDGNEKLSWVNHTHEVLFETEKLLGAFRDAETGQRGYLLTRNPSYLEPYHRALVSIASVHNQLMTLTSDNPDQQKLLREMVGDMDAKLAELKQTIELTNQGELNQALKIVENDHGKQFMDNIRADINQFASNELLLLELRKGEYNESRARITTLIAVEFVLFVCLAILTYVFVRNSLFKPLNRLISSAKMVERGERVIYSDMLPNDEIGQLSRTFMLMSEKVYQREQTLQLKAHYDELTGLKNRASLDIELKDALYHGEIHSTKTAVLFLDLNKLKQLNDTRGHEAGDCLLRETANRLQTGLRSSDQVYRIGGDEFIVILKDIHDKQDVCSALESLLSNLKTPARIADSLVPVSLSIGVAIAPDDSEVAADLIKYADMAMYRAKSKQHKRYCFYTDKIAKELELDQSAG